MANDFYVDNMTDFVFGLSLGPKFLTTHDNTQCASEFCSVHNPSDHHMREWRTTWRTDKRQLERTCLHGIGHPDPDDLAFHISHGRDFMGIHGCDGCCINKENDESSVSSA